MKAAIGQLDMFAELEPPPAVQSNFPTRWEVVPAALRSGATADNVEASYSADVLESMGKVVRAFGFRGEEWVMTGASHYRGGSDLECYRIVPLACFDGPGEARTYHDHDFHGPNRQAFGGYHGMQAKHRGADVVLIGPPIVVVVKAHQQ